MQASSVILILSFLFSIWGSIFSFAQNKTICFKDLNQLNQFNKGVVHDCLDLSNQNLDSMPDLSHLKIKELNLSHNQISNFKETYLPINVKSVNLSYNNLTEFEFPINNCARLPVLVDLSKLDLSHNKLTKVELHYLANLSELKDIRLDNNNLTYLHLQDPRYIEFLDVSNNLKLRSDVPFQPEKIKTIKSDNIADKRPLYYFLGFPPAPLNE